jgi:uncharacterized protein involved in exopolysaccharide biosynthesis
MNIFQFFRILWARRVLIFASAGVCLVLGIIASLVLPAKWEGSARVMLNSLKPDPVTGEVLGGTSMRQYVGTQIQLVTDYSVAERTVDQLGWANDPEKQERFRKVGKADVHDFRQSLAKSIIDSSRAKLVADSNIIEISYTASTPMEAKKVADLLRRAYIDTSLDLRRQDANRNADWFEKQAEAAKVTLSEAEAEKSRFEKANGIIMADETTDLESARLRSLAGGSAPAPTIAAQVSESSPSAGQLAELDARIAEGSKVLGPNHPELLAMRASRATLAAQVARERSSMGAQASASAAAARQSANALDQAVEQQKARVLAQSEKLGKLQQLQNEVNLRKEQFTKALQKEAQYREEGAVGDLGLTPLGAAYVPSTPKFPNIMLLIPGSLVAGLGLGVVLALLVEILNRPIRGVEDFSAFKGLPILAVIETGDGNGPRVANARISGPFRIGSRGFGAGT